MCCKFATHTKPLLTLDMFLIDWVHRSRPYPKLHVNWKASRQCCHRWIRQRLQTNHGWICSFAPIIRKEYSKVCWWMSLDQIELFSLFQPCSRLLRQAEVSMIFSTFCSKKWAWIDWCYLKLWSLFRPSEQVWNSPRSTYYKNQFYWACFTWKRSLMTLLAMHASE